ncbi:MAG: sulfide/dihydroorotate dehydrogenase-like FAD/NAD-binding protein [Alphaproteobacteria bacterium]|nr:sulfide/dihydroorotate dehydrogenase-like FAD/NAD-binding protein [Alphaproteobacteria bacterium]
MFQIISKAVMAQGSVVQNEIMAPLVAANAKPGQFLILRVDETGERIPLTISDSDPKAGTVTIVYQVVGRTTSQLAALEPGGGIRDVVGPLGQPTDIRNVGTVVCVGGGSAAAVLRPIIRGFKAAGNKVVSIVGARSQDLVILEEQIKSASDELHICTSDGSYGRSGFVTDVLREILEKDEGEIKEVVAIGPIPMMKACCDVTAEFKVKTLVSLNALMVDGTGMCGCCRVMVGGQVRFACVDGPEFDGHLVDFDALSARLSAYRAHELESKEHHDACQCEDQGAKA